MIIFFTAQRKKRILEIYNEFPGIINFLLKPDGTIFIACEDEEEKMVSVDLPIESWRHAYREAVERLLRLLDIFLDD